jgi:hypothetical protein
MRAKPVAVIALVVFLAGTAACYRPYGYRFYPDAPRFAPTSLDQVELLRRAPRRDHIRLGEVWIRPTPRMSRFYVEGVLREKTAAMGGDALVIVADKFFRDGVVFSYWHGPRPVYERQIVGIAIRYQR